MERDQAKPVTTLADALERMTFSVDEGPFALVALDGPPGPTLATWLSPPAQVVLEDGETSVLAREEEALAVAAGSPGARVERDLAWIRFDAPMGWELVGFLAHVTGRLAAAGVPLGCVCSHARDHLFVARPYLERARAVLRELFPETAASRAANRPGTG